MKLVTIDLPPAGQSGALIGDEVLNFGMAHDVAPMASWIPASVATILAGGDEGLDIARRVVGAVEDGPDSLRQRLRERGALTRYDDTHLMAPVPRPGMLLSHGRAYMSHLREMQKTDNPTVAENPTGFPKNINSIIGSGQPIVLPKQAPDMVDHEGEFSVVFGRYCHNVAEEDVMSHVAGYTIINDVSARDWVHTFRDTGDPEVNRMGKQFPTFTPMGPVVVTKDEIADPHKLNMTSRINGEVFQSACTDDLIWTIPQLISYFARWYAFAPGDVLTTGSPPGVGFGRDPKVFMHAGDVCEITVDGVGTLRNPIVAAS